MESLTWNIHADKDFFLHLSSASDNFALRSCCCDLQLGSCAAIFLRPHYTCHRADALSLKTYNSISEIGSTILTIKLPGHGSPLALALALRNKTLIRLPLVHYYLLIYE